jgi:hypothetical protein
VAPYTSQQHRAAAAEASAKLASDKLRAALPDALCKVSRVCCHDSPHSGIVAAVMRGSNILGKVSATLKL